MSSFGTRLGTQSFRYRRRVQPLFFPSEEPDDEKMPETRRHLIMRTALWQILSSALGEGCSTGCEQFVYFDASNPRRCCAPDAFVKLGVPSHDFDSWKAWEKGAPEVVVEILSRHDKERWTWKQKLDRFHALGAREVVRFDADARAGSQLRVWDRVKDDLVERVVRGDTTPSAPLGLTWIVRPLAHYPRALRVARDGELLLTPQESLDAANRRLDATTSRLDAADRRVAELEAELAKRGRKR